MSLLVIKFLDVNAKRRSPATSVAMCSQVRKNGPVTGLLELCYTPC